MKFNFPNNKPPQHGGALQQAIKLQRQSAPNSTPIENWIDASTGISPFPYPVAKIPERCFQRLPEANLQLQAVAHNYYRPQESRFGLLPISGSQWFIQRFPEIIGRWLINKTRLKVLLPKLGYSEHEFWWRYYNHGVAHYEELKPLSTLNSDVVVIINPNNPTTASLKNTDIQELANRNPDTLIIVDEAFIDTSPANSCLQLTLANNLIILRSLGKFFALAGLRIGFVFAHQPIIEALALEQGPWPISGPGEWLAQQALGDRAWQQQARSKLKAASDGQQKLLAQLPINAIRKVTHCDYFSSLFFARQEQAYKFHQQLLANGVLTRYFNEAPLVRIGIINPVDQLCFRDRCLSALE